MSSLRIAIAARTVANDAALVAYGKSRFSTCDLIVAEKTHHTLEGSDLLNLLKHCDGAVIGRELISDAVLAELPALKAISIYGVGTDNIDFLACQKHGVEVLESPGVNADAAAEFTIGLMIGVCRNLAFANHSLRNGVWKKDGGTQLSGKSVTIVGVGAIGSKVARSLRAWGCSVQLVDLRDVGSLAREIGATETDLESGLRSAEVLSLHVPLTNLTRGMVGAKELGSMNQGTFLINAARAEIVDQDALKNSLKSGHLAGVGLDVFPNEPEVDPELVAHPNVLATPHIAGNAKEAVLAAGRSAIGKLAEYFNL